MDKRDADINGRLLTQARRQEKDVTFGRWCCCLNCGSWSGKGCFRAQEQVPPPQVIVHGCPAWEIDIPF